MARERRPSLKCLWSRVVAGVIGGEEVLPSLFIDDGVLVDCTEPFLISLTRINDACADCCHIHVHVHVDTPVWWLFSTVWYQQLMLPHVCLLSCSPPCPPAGTPSSLTATSGCYCASPCTRSPATRWGEDTTRGWGNGVNKGVEAERTGCEGTAVSGGGVTEGGFIGVLG